MVEKASRTPTELELHRAAAWWAGEGSVRSHGRKLGVSFAQKEACVCHWFKDLFGGTVCRKAPTATRNEISYWTASGDNARNFLRAIVELIPESPRRQAQIRAALEATAGRLKTGPKPSPTCRLGHMKVGRHCPVCEGRTRVAYRSRPEVAARHREQERNRYQAKKETQHAPQEA